MDLRMHGTQPTIPMAALPFVTLRGRTNEVQHQLMALRLLQRYEM
jgi:hypothetical protein